MSESNSPFYLGNQLWGQGISYIRNSAGEIVDESYGYPLVWIDPHNFKPDPEGATEQELAHWELSKHCSTLEAENKKMRGVVSDVQYWHDQYKINDEILEQYKQELTSYRVDLVKFQEGIDKIESLETKLSWVKTELESAKRTMGYSCFEYILDGINNED